MEKVLVTNINKVDTDLEYQTMINELFNTYIESIYVELANLLIELKYTIETLKENSDKIKFINKQIETIKIVNLSLKEDNEKSKKEKLEIYSNIDTDRTKLFKNFRERESRTNEINDRMHHSNETINVMNAEITKLNEQIKNINSESRELGILFSNQIRNIITLLTKINIEGFNFDKEDLKINKLKCIDETNLSDLDKASIRKFIAVNYYLRLSCFEFVKEYASDIIDCYRNNNYLEIDRIVDSNKFKLIIQLLLNNDLTKYNNIGEIRSSTRFKIEFKLSKEILNYLKGNIYEENYIEHLSPILVSNRDNDIYEKTSLFVKAAEDEKKEKLEHGNTSKR